MKLTPELIQCNGRWGGTSLQMTLMNRLFGLDALRYDLNSVTMRGLARLDFPALLEHFEEDLFDIRTALVHESLLTPATASTQVLDTSNIEEISRWPRASPPE